MAARARYVLFVHGIGPQELDYSAGLWNQLWENQSPIDANRRQLYYYDIFETADAKTKMKELAVSVGSVLNGLVVQKWPQAKLDKPLANILEDTVAHVLYFTTMTDVREAITDKFQLEISSIIKDANAKGFYFPNIEITIASHSLGTVVAYLGMHAIVHDAALGLQSDVRVRNLYTLASPLELIRRVGSALSPVASIEHITTGIERPTEVDPTTGKAKSNIRSWYTYRNLPDPVASLAPLRGAFLDGSDDPPFKFLDLAGGNLHGFGTYIQQARLHMVSVIRGVS
jgi:hypothetical protein